MTERVLCDLDFLVVEDHEFQRTLLEQALRSLGAVKVTSVANGKEAIRRMRTGDIRFDIVITDLRMPEVDGIELLPLLRQTAPGVAVVLASVDRASLDVATVIARGNRVPVLGAIEKPITPDKLRPLLDQYLAQPGR